MLINSLVQNDRNQCPSTRSFYQLRMLPKLINSRPPFFPVRGLHFHHYGKPGGPILCKIVFLNIMDFLGVYMENVSVAKPNTPAFVESCGSAGGEFAIRGQQHLSKIRDFFAKIEFYFAFAICNYPYLLPIGRWRCFGFFRLRFRRRGFWFGFCS